MKYAFILSGLAALVTPRIAGACEPPVCTQGYFVPADSAHVPANLPAIRWRAIYEYDNSGQDSMLSNVTLTDADGNVIALTATQVSDTDWDLVPATRLLPNTSYTIDDATTCNITHAAGPRATFFTTPDQPLPTTLGTSAWTTDEVSSLQLATASGSCNVNVQADQVALTVALDPATQPWQEVLLYDTQIDGVPWMPRDDYNEELPPGASWTGRGRDTAYRVCSDPQGQLDGTGLTEGGHTAVFHATLPGTTLDLTSSPASFLIQCEPVLNDDEPFGDDPVPDGGTTPDAANPDNGASGGGCCSASGGGGAAGAVWLAAGVVALVYGRRRDRLSSKRRSES